LKAKSKLETQRLLKLKSKVLASKERAGYLSRERG